MARNPIPRMTAAEYLAMERASPFKSEFAGGEVSAMPGGLPANSQLISRFCRELEDALEDGPGVVTVAELRRSGGSRYVRLSGRDGGLRGGVPLPMGIGT